jgi:hypothetical protein
MILDAPVPLKSLRPVDDERHRRRVGRIVAAFAAAFPEIRYDVYWESSTANAQAFFWEGHRCVRLYGGLARHRQLSVAAIAWVLAHETGHHLAGPPFHDLHPGLSSEAASDAWAAVTGLQHAVGDARARRYRRVGRRELSQSSLTARRH